MQVGVLRKTDKEKTIMSENEMIIGEGNAQSSLDCALKCSEEYLGMRERPIIFNRYDDAAFYYREKTINAAKNAIETAVENADEVTEVKAYKNLFDVLSNNLAGPEQKKMFDDCYVPLVEILTTDKAKGLLYYQLGHCSESLQQPSSEFFENAVKLNNENVLAEDVFRKNPKFVYLWLEHYFNDPEQKNLAKENENLLNSLVNGSEEAAEYYFKMGGLFKDDFEHSDRYYRDCIKLGYKNVVEDPRYFTEDYEGEFIDWFKSRLKESTDIYSVMDLCFVKLWNSKESGAFSCSKKLWAEIVKEKDFSRGCNEYGTFADEGLEWAENWLLEHIEDKRAQVAVSDCLIERWFRSEQNSQKYDSSLGLLFVGGRCTQLQKQGKYHMCISRYYMEKGEYVASMASFLRCTKETIASFIDYHRDLRHSVCNNYAEIILQRAKEKNLFGSQNLIPAKIDSYDKFYDMKIHNVSSLGEYFNKNRLAENIFRERADSPNCTRYFLLNHMAKLAGSSGDIDFKSQEDSFRRQAKKELDDAICEYDVMALFVWIEESLFSDSQEKNNAAIRVLCDLIQSASPRKMPLPYFLLANYWSRRNVDDEIVPKVLSWLFDDGSELDSWKLDNDLNVVLKKTYEMLSLGKK